MFETVKTPQHMAEIRISKSPFVADVSSSLKPVDIKVIPIMASSPESAFIRLILSFKIRIARKIVKIMDVLERTEAFADVVSFCPKNWDIKPNMFKRPRNATELFFKIENFLSDISIIKIAKKEAKANLINKRSRGFENFRAYLIIGKEVLQRNEAMRIKIILSIF